MIKLNNRDCEWHEGLTVEDLLKQKNFTYPRIVVSVNTKIIQKEDYASTVINDGDNVEAIHLMAGG
ncbi:thiamine biosynthesis protein ThiS [Desulfosporosinus sp. HMP52]|uniref:sulfur carrier protein ThiS n=1 Tax=Desulfosporosinus sp. HMP52 TaxID=1487923 RepID=UPI00051F869D|nr:sulfur carrier protein ThiS [Desulfosporosinus sp. HMP52]KGK89619.1 thiamine biosynthesis protein ThiS [Desulfosporosinus sp. HMP52]